MRPGLATRERRRRRLDLFHLSNFLRRPGVMTRVSFFCRTLGYHTRRRACGVSGQADSLFGWWGVGPTYIYSYYSPPYASLSFKKNERFPSNHL